VAIVTGAFVLVFAWRHHASGSQSLPSDKTAAPRRPSGGDSPDQRLRPWTARKPTSTQTAFIDWVSQNPAVTINENVTFHPCADRSLGLCLYAEADIPTETGVLCIHNTLRIDLPFAVERSPDVGTVLTAALATWTGSEPHAHDAHNALLSVFLARLLFEPQLEQTVADVLGPYLMAVPVASARDDLPDLWTPAERAELHIDYPERAYGAIYEVVKRLVLDPHPELFGSPLRAAYSERAWTTAMAIRASRAFAASLAMSQESQSEVAAAAAMDPKDISAILPVLDMVNAGGAGEEAVIAARVDDMSCLVTRRNVTRGADVRTTYGLKLQPSHMSAYGYLHFAQRADALLLPVNAGFYYWAARSHVPDWAFSSVPADETQRPVFVMRLPETGEFPAALLAHQRLVTLNIAEAAGDVSDPVGSQLSLEMSVARAFCARQPDFDAGCGISPANERASREALAKAFADKLAIYPTTFEDDVARIQGIESGKFPRPSKKLMLALHYRARLKRTLRSAQLSLQQPF
jgi:hypothetical protein